MKIAVIGYGKIGKIRHKFCKELYPDFEFKISDPYINTNTPQEVINWCDSCFICTPNKFNVEYTIYAINNNKHVFCEKPPAISYDELLKVKDVYKENLTLLYGFNHRQYDSVQMIKNVISDKESGKILWMRGRYGKAMGGPSSMGWRVDPYYSGGGILLDQGIHMIDLILYFGGNFDKVQSILTNSLWGINGIEDNAFLNLYSSDKKISASIHSTMIEWRHVFSLEILLENKYIALNGLKTPSGSYGNEILTICNDKRNKDNISHSSSYEFKNNNTWEKEIKIFIDSIKNNINKTNLTDALNVMKIIKEAYNGR